MSDPTLKDELQVLAAKQTHFSLGAVVAFMILSGLLFFGLHRISLNYEKNLAYFEASQQALRKQLKETEATVETERKLRSDLEKKQAEVKTQIEYRDRVVVKEVAKVTNPEMTVQQVSDTAKLNFKLNYDPHITERQGLQFIGFLKPDVQQFLATKIEKEGLDAKIVDMNKLFQLELDKNKSLDTSLHSVQESLNACKSTVDSCKKVAELTKKKKFMDALKRYGIYATISVASYEVGKHSH